MPLEAAPATVGPTSALELWASDPTATRVVAVRCRSRLPEAVAGLGPADLVAIALSPADRVRARRDIRRAGLSIIDEVVALPRGDSWRQLLSLRPDAADSLEAAIGGRKGRVVGAAARWRVGQRLLSLVAPGLVLFAGREPRAPAGWRGRDAGPAMHVTRERLDAATVVVRSPDAVSAPVSKVGLDPDGRARIDREASIGLAVAATLVDLATPRQVPGPPWALALSPVTGEPASNVLRRTPSRAAQVVRPLIDAFGAWHRRTASDGNGTDWITRLVRPPVDRLRPAVPSLARYLAHVVELAEAAGPVRLVATHGDLTMSNVLVGTDTLGVVDWEAAESSGMPLADLWYAVADATVCARGLDRATAVSELAGGRDTWGAVSQIDAVADALGMSADARELAFQLTWVMHAANEVDRDGTGGEFLAVLHTVAARRA